MDMAERERREIAFWHEDANERPESDSVENIINKAIEARPFLGKLDRYAPLFDGRNTILELGAGQGWAACLVKRRYPRSTVIATDISEAALRSVTKWERIYNTTLDRTMPARSYSIPIDDASVDLTFAWQAAHHFGRHKRTLDELHRILRPGGVVLYLSEPVCSAALHAIAHRRVNATRPQVPEDVLVWRNIITLAQTAGFAATVHFQNVLTSERLLPWLYRRTLATFPLLHRFLISTADFVFMKPLTTATQHSALDRVDKCRAQRSR